MSEQYNPMRPITIKIIFPVEQYSHSSVWLNVFHHTKLVSFLPNVRSKRKRLPGKLQQQKVKRTRPSPAPLPKGPTFSIKPSPRRLSPASLCYFKRTAHHRYYNNCFAAAAHNNTRHTTPITAIVPSTLYIPGQSQIRAMEVLLLFPPCSVRTTPTAVHAQTSAQKAKRKG